MNKAFTRESDGADDDVDDDLRRAGAAFGRAQLPDAAGLQAAARRADGAARRRAAEDRRDGLVGGEERRPLGERRLPLRQEAAARDRPAASASSPRRLDIAEVADPSLHHGNEQIFFGATVTYANARGEEKT
jgi:transcription elongation factor GreB